MVGRATRIERLMVASRAVSSSRGYLAGEAPSIEEPDIDGRLRIMNQPAVGRILVLDRISMTPVAMTRSLPDGTWRVNGLDLGRKYLVIGLDDRGLQNAAIQDWITPAPMD